MSGTYGNSHSRTKILQAIAWSFQVLRTFHAQFELLDNSVNHPAASICHPGTGIYPAKDPWNRTFDGGYFPRRAAKAGKKIAGQFVAVLEGIQGDQDYIRILFQPERHQTCLRDKPYIYIYIYFFYFIFITQKSNNGV